MVDAYLVVKVFVHKRVRKHDFPTCGLPTINILNVMSGCTTILSRNCNGYRKQQSTLYYYQNVSCT